MALIFNTTNITNINRDIQILALFLKIRMTMTQAYFIKRTPKKLKKIKKKI